MEEIEGSIPDPTAPVPNNQYDSSHTVIATIKSTTDSNNFFNSYNYYNKYKGLKLGQIIDIKMSKYSTMQSWYIAGFDCENNHKASDGNIKDNGPGICLIPVDDMSYLYEHYAGDGYINSDMHNIELPDISSGLQDILSYHLVYRNLLLSDSTGNSGSDGYKWTVGYMALLSGYQLTGKYYSNSYDTGEANYKLPLFNYMSYNDYVSNTDENYGFWIRGLEAAYNPKALNVRSDGTIEGRYSNFLGSIRTMIYVR